jgi:hypothetical protein
MAGAKLQDLKGLLLPLSRGGGGAVSLHGQRSGSRLATGRGGGSAARCPGAPGGACLARWSTEAANQAMAAHWPARLGSVLRGAGWGEARGGGGSRGKVRGRLSRAPFIGHEREVPARTPRRRCCRGGLGHWLPDGPRRAWRAGAGRAFGLGLLGKDRVLIFFRN